MASSADLIGRAVLVILASAVMFALLSYYNSHAAKARAEKFAPAPASRAEVQEEAFHPKPAPPPGASEYAPAKLTTTHHDEQHHHVAADPCGRSRERVTASDLLPKDAANCKWAQANPAGQGDVADQNFLNAGFHTGINTVASTHRNPNLQIRSEPPNPKFNVGPWQNSDIQPDLLRRPLEIGGD